MGLCKENLLLSVFFQRKRDQAVQQLAVLNAGSAEQLGIHADCRKARQRVQLIEQHGDDGFRDIENRVNASIDVQNSIIATGGSVVYGAEAMAHLKSIGTVVYLRLTCENITERLGDLHARGVTIKPGWTLRDLYNERCPLYEQYADIVQDWLAQRMGRLGYLYDVWFPDREPHRTLCVSERGVDE